LRLPVQWSTAESRFSAASRAHRRRLVRPGDRVRVLPSGKESRVARIVAKDGDLAVAIAASRSR